MVYDWCIDGLNRKYQQLYSGNGLESSSAMAKYQPSLRPKMKFSLKFSTKLETEFHFRSQFETDREFWSPISQPTG